MGDETARAYGAADKVWQLESIDGALFAERATMEFREPGKIGGAGPCNTWFAAMDAPYPWFKVERVGATKRACRALQQEGLFFAALRAMTLIEVSGDVLVLSTPEGREMVFRAGADG